jgi:large subunit ribosomal protein L15
MKQHDLQPALGATHARKRVGRGDGSGHGTYSGRGCKGQKARAGKPVRLGFEGGQLPLFRRLPHKRGFPNTLFRVEYDVVNLASLEVFDAGSEITPDVMLGLGLVKGDKPVKVLGDGELTKALKVSADKFSASAKAKIEAAGGTATELQQV